MIVKLTKNATVSNVKNLEEFVKSKGLHLTDISGENIKVFGILGDTLKLEIGDLESLEYVEKATRIQEPFKKANKKFKIESTIIDVKGVKIGGNNFTIISGPCSVENREQILQVANDVKKSGAQILRGGAYKPRTSPYSFQGLKLNGLKLLKEASIKTGLPIITEIMSPYLVETFVENVDIIQVGARNMQNFDLLRELGKTNKPIFLKRGMSATIEEWLMSAEYVMASGNTNVILCERGIRTFENYTRNTLDLSAILAVKKLSHLPVFVDPSHATGKSWMVEKLSFAAAAIGADGVMIEAHNNPEKALCDGAQSLKSSELSDFVEKLKQFVKLSNKII